MSLVGEKGSHLFAKNEVNERYSDFSPTSDTPNPVSNQDMSDKNQVMAMFLIGLLSGFGGGMLAVLTVGHGKTGSQSQAIIQAKQFDAITASGVVRARFGIESGDNPAIKLFAPNGAERLTIGLDNVDEPLIMMRDTKQNIRAVLGHETSDTASPEDDNWWLWFEANGGDDGVVSAIGMTKDYPSPKYKGVVSVRIEREHWHNLTPK